jgi:sugar lactone lactonase YvrE
LRTSASANPLRRVVPGGPVETVAYDAGVRLLGLATGGGDRLYGTQPEALVAMDIDDAGAIASATRSDGPGGTSFGDITFVRSPFGDAFFFVDISSGRTFRKTPDGGIEHVLTSQPDAGRATSIASRSADGVAKGAVVYVATSLPSGKEALVSFPQYDTEAFAGAHFGNQEILLDNGANGVVIDSARRFFVATALGITTLSPMGTLDFPQRPVSVRISAIPTCLTFGGADRKTLFVTTVAGKIYSIPVTTPGILR